MPKSTDEARTGAVRLTGDAAFAAHTREVAERNAKAHGEARKLRDAQRDREAARKRARDDRVG
jgi:tRNA(Arg) A34 adenosine deaminase TadA